MADSALAWRAFLAVADCIVQGEGEWPEALVLALERAVGADTVGYAADLETGLLGYSANVGGPPLSDDERVMWRSYHDEYPFFSVLLNGGEGRAERASDRLSRTEFRRTVVYAEHFGPRRARYQANFGLVHDGHLAMLGLYRAARDFHTAEIDALERGRVLLIRALQYRSAVDELDAMATTIDPASASPARSVLTLRQQEVLALVATGATDRRIARHLKISERTVRKHLTDIRNRLDVGGRVAAAAWWLTNAGGAPAQQRGTASFRQPPALLAGSPNSLHPDRQRVNH